MSRVSGPPGHDYLLDLLWEASLNMYRGEAAASKRPEGDER